jgi:excisionase family DNA binding protein
VSANDNDAVLTVSELCARWKCTRKSVLDLIHEGRLHAFRLGKRSYRVALVEVLRWELERKAA